METGKCLFQGNCLIAGEICNRKTMQNCRQAQRRKDRAKKDCPIMVQTGGKNKKCHVSQLLQFLPLAFDCHNGKDCLVCKMIPNTVAKVAKHNSSDGRSKMSEEDIEKAGVTLVEALKIKKIKKLEEHQVAVEVTT